MTVGGMGFIPERLLMMMMMITAVYWYYYHCLVLLSLPICIFNVPYLCLFFSTRYDT